jgi:hypothetical protein
MKWIDVLLAVLVVFAVLMVAGLHGQLQATELTAQDAEGPYPSVLPVPTNDLDISFTAWPNTAVGDVTFEITGRELLIVKNSNTVTGATVTFESQPILGRSGSIENYSLGAGDIAVFWYGDKRGWANSSNIASVSAGTTAVEFALVQVDL